MTLRLTIDVPDPLAEKAREAGLLERKEFAAMLERELNRRDSAEEFFDMLEKIRAVSGQPMSTGEIQAEIDAYRAERRASGENRS